MAISDGLKQHKVQDSRNSQRSLPARGAGAGAGHVVARATVLALASLAAVLPVAPVGTLDVALLTCKEV